jgi:two-component system chemotaxis response regulator CheB
MRNIVCIGGSTGAFVSIERIIRRLPADLPAAVFVVRHIAPDNAGTMAHLLQPHSALPVAEAINGEEIRNGRIYVAPANRHLLLDARHVRLANGPKENWARPAIDPLFRTAAQFHSSRVIGIVLSGKLDDGAGGLWALKRRGGFAVVQDPKDASAPDMPRNALAAVDVDVVADADKIGTMLPEWCRETHAPSVSSSTERFLEVENASLLQGKASPSLLDEIGVRAAVVCPDCGGQLWQMKEGPLRYRCHVGHSQSAHSLLAQQTVVVEKAGWELIRSIEEDDHLCENMLQQRLSPEEEKALRTRLSRNREKLDQLRALLVEQQTQVA